MNVRTIKSHTRHERTRVLSGAPRVTFNKQELQPTAVRYWWTTESTHPESVEVLGRRILKNGRVGSTLVTVTYFTEDLPGWYPMPEWVRDLIDTKLT